MVSADATNCQRTPLQENLGLQISDQGSAIVCSKQVVGTYAHKWSLEGSRVFETVNVCAYAFGTLRVEGDIRQEYMQSNRDEFRTRVLPLFAPFHQSLQFCQISTGVPRPVAESLVSAESFLNTVCKVEGLKEGSFKFMVDQFISDDFSVQSLSVPFPNGKV